MTATEMINLMNRIPFSPLEIHLTDGSRIMIEHPYEIATRPNSPSCTIYGNDGLMRIIAYRNITQIVTSDEPQPV